MTIRIVCSVLGAWELSSWLLTVNGYVTLSIAIIASACLCFLFGLGLNTVQLRLK